MGRPRLLSSSTIVDCAAGGLSAAKSLLLLRDLAVPCPASCFCEPPTSLPTHPHARQTEPFESWTTGASESPPPTGLDEDEDEEAVHRVSSKLCNLIYVKGSDRAAEPREAISSAFYIRIS